MDKVQMNALLAEMKAGSVLAAGRKGVAQAAQRPGDFASLLKGALGEVNDAQMKAQSLAQQFQIGNPAVSLEETMVSLQKSSLSLQFLVQVRNRMVSAYHDIMNMQV